MRRSSFLLCMLALGACTSDTFVGDDGGGDTGTVSGGDGSSEAGHAEGGKVEAGPTRYCDTVDAQFCADFDLPEDAGAGFLMPPNENGGWAFTFQDAQASSAPIAVRVDTRGDAGGVAAIAPPPLSDGGVKTKLVVEADVYLPNAMPATPDPIFVFSGGTLPGPTLTFGLAEQSGLWKLCRPNLSGLATLSPQPDTSTWVHAVLTIFVSGLVTLDIGSSHAQLAGPTTPDGGFTSFPGALSVGGGDAYISVSDRTYFVDNVIARWQ